MIRLNKYIATCGVCSRRKADELITQRKVRINGVVTDNLGLQIDETKDKVEIYNKEIALEKKKVYLMLNKPKGYITTNDEQFSRPSTVDLIHEEIRVFPIGRLDMETEGLLLFTNDGEFANSLTHPKNKVEKTYVVKVSSDISDKKQDRLKKGLDIGGYVTKPAKVRMLSKNEIEIVIAEGKNRQIRKMCEAAGISLVSLKRTQVGVLELGDLKSGEYRYLKPTEVKSFIQNDKSNVTSTNKFKKQTQKKQTPQKTNSKKVKKTHNIYKKV